MLTIRHPPRLSQLRFEVLDNKKATIPPPPPSRPPPLKPAGTSVMLLLSMQGCRIFSSWGRRMVVCLQPHWQRLHWSPSGQWRLLLLAVKQSDERPAPQYAAFSSTGSVGEDPGAVLGKKESKGFVLFLSTWINVPLKIVVAAAELLGLILAAFGRQQTTALCRSGTESIETSQQLWVSWLRGPWTQNFRQLVLWHNRYMAVPVFP